MAGGVSGVLDMAVTLGFAFKAVASKLCFRDKSHESTACSANPNVTATSNTPKTPPSKRQSQCDWEENCSSHKTLHLRSEIILHTSSSHVSTRFLAISQESVMLPSKTLSKSIAQCQRHSALPRKTFANATTTSREQDSTSTPQT